MSTTNQSAEDAMNIASAGHDAVQHHGYVPGDINVTQLAAAARRLVDEIYRLRSELERQGARARDVARPEAPRVEGHPLHHGRDAGGRRHFVGGRPVHCGQPLYLLTDLGWYPVRYEANMPKGQALLYFGLPGESDEFFIIAPAGRLRLAWPDELKRSTSSLFDRSGSVFF